MRHSTLARWTAIVLLLSCGFVVAQYDEGLDLPPYPFDPCGSHGVARGQKCVCHEVCRGSHCSTGTSTLDGSQVVGYDIRHCIDCACLPTRTSDMVPEPECPADAPKSADEELVVVCCKDAESKSGEVDLINIDILETREKQWFNKIPICKVVIERSFGYQHESVEASFLNFIIERYDDLPATILFTHFENEWHDQIDKAMLLSVNGSKNAAVTAESPFLPFPSPLATSDEHFHHEEIKAWIDKRKSMTNIELKDKFHCCSQFKVHKTAILRHSKEVYEELKEAAWNNEIGSAALEMMWQVLFTNVESDWDEFWTGLDKKVSDWRTESHMSKCEPWGCTCQGFSELFGAAPGAIDSVNKEQKFWWKHGS